MSPTQRPPFLYPPGSVLMHSPLALGRSQMYGFYVKGSIAALQASVDASLNQCTRGQMQFKVLTPYVMLTFTDVTHANSLHPDDRAKGWGQETDIVTWVMVGQVKAGETKISHVYFYPMHIWVNDCMALINGRELYGYPKYECEYTMPSSVDAASTFTLAAKGFQPFAPDTELAMHPLLDVRGAGTGQPNRRLGGWSEWIAEMLALLKSLPGFWAFDEAAWQQLLALLKQPQIDQIFLKQLPDGSGQRAVYQAIVTAPAVVEQIHAIHLLGDDYTLNLHEFASFPLDRSLGWVLGSQKAILPFAINFDFKVTEGVELVDNSVLKKERIAVLGGGVGAMSAVWGLTSQPGWQNRYEIDVYQMGWRIGGKGASGRNATLGERIEEHGLHIWFGFYDNAFTVMQQAYAELGRAPGTPLATWDEAFKPQHYIALTEFIRGECKLWGIDTPPVPGIPGPHSERLSLWAAIRTALAWIRQWLGHVRSTHLASPEHAQVGVPNDSGSWLHRLAEHVERDVAHLASDLAHALHAFEQWVQHLPEALDQHDPAHHALLAETLHGLRDWVRQRFDQDADLSDDLRRLLLCIDLATTTLAGMIADHVPTQGFEAINDIDFYAWLAKHGARDSTVHSAPVRGFYDLVFAYEDGDFDRPNIEAGTMLRGMMKVALCYHGAIMFKMQAGMGDVVFTPLYDVLKRRGVRFHYFHKVLDLQPDPSQPLVDTITLQQQVKLAVPEYAPLRSVNGLDCWPSEPRYEQLDPTQAALLQKHGINLESHWSPWPEIHRAATGEDLPTRVLKRGVDFDRIVFGLSVGSLPEVAAPLLARSPALAACSTNVKVVATQAYQVWMSEDIRTLGWTLYGRDGQEPVLSAFVEPYDTWAPMDQLLCREAWPAPIDPKNVSYFCSAFPCASYPPPGDITFPQRMAAQARQGALNQVQNELQPLWPKAYDANGFRFDWMVDPSGATGAARFDAQYWRANVDPSERYVLSVVNSTQYRLQADGTGFANLVIAGDWLKTGLDAGCVEAGVMGGLQASRAISGWPAVIRGEGGF